MYVIWSAIGIGLEHTLDTSSDIKVSYASSNKRIDDGSTVSKEFRREVLAYVDTGNDGMR